MTRILVADDMPDIGNILSMGLTHAGYQVVVVRDGEAALAEALSGPFDLAILDIHMPKMSGTEVLQRLRAATLPRQFPVIMLTANPSKDEQTRHVDLGADGYCIKPFHIAEVVQLIKALLPTATPGDAPTAP